MSSDTVTREAALAAMRLSSWSLNHRRGETHESKARMCLRLLAHRTPEDVVDDAKAFVLAYKDVWPGGCACQLYRLIENGILRSECGGEDVVKACDAPAAAYMLLPPEVARVLCTPMPMTKQCWCTELGHECECYNHEAYKEHAARVREARKIPGVRVESNNMYHRRPVTPIRRPAQVVQHPLPGWMHEDTVPDVHESRKRTLEVCEQIVRTLKKARQEAPEGAGQE